VNWLQRRRAVAAAARAERVAAAEREVELSRQRLNETRENVVEPLQAAAAHNNFAELIRASLVQGYRDGGAR
jgi:aspartate/tyrosine/aromatic aminotransferase